MSDKRMAIAAILAFFTGAFGIHDFYLGYTKQGFIKLGLSFAGVVLSVIDDGLLLIFAVNIWALVDFFMILTRNGRLATDSSGRRLG
ncbi:hypothetical protein CAQU_03745 [Corynebacterium aquilae DSM 44791]|uniref:TM2 domain-containing protein n=1 Tax=Corynebacterium aquilae DSM 44791 TaxID=1431546 RepID=A0A1L7CIS4_9CORY|nr:hypothetical protein CAQU_03745 [Corynebacterium aquilae DSM 44791]